MNQAADTISCPDALIAKLEMGGRLGEEDRAALRALCGDVRHIPAHRDIIREGDRPDHVHLMMDGWAARYKIVPDGARQITAFLIPGDFCDAHVAILGQMDHGIVALTDSLVGYIAQVEIETLPLHRPELARALWWATLVDEAVLRSWIVNLGRRDAHERVSHLLCELKVRLRNVGLVEGERFALPLTQEVLADSLGLSAVHINRVLQRLRSEGLITLKGGTLTILDAAGLGRAAGFDPNYLHVKRRRN
jgi:CRP-like cAMP-binding protein